MSDYNLNFKEKTFGGRVPFIDSAHQRFVTGGATIDADHAIANRVNTNGQVILRDEKPVLLPGSFISEQADGLYRVYTPAANAVKASLVIGEEASDNAISITAVAAGVAGNDIRFAIVDPGQNNTTIGITVVDNVIQVKPVTEDETEYAVTSTAAEIIAAVNGDGAAGALVLLDDEGDSDGSGAVEYTEFANLEGGADAVSENLDGNRTLILYDEVELEDGNAVVTGIDHGRVISARLPLAPDATVISNLPGVIFI